MLIAERIEPYIRHPRGVIHVGANVGEERFWYTKMGFENVLWFEPNKELFPKLEENIQQLVGHKAYNVGLYDEKRNNAILHIASNSGQSSSLLDFETHRNNHPTVSFTHNQNIKLVMGAEFLELLKVNPKDYNFLNIDVQGVELNVLKGLGGWLYTFDYLYIEVNEEQVYKGCAEIGEIDNYLKTFQFERAETHITKAKWGDALYVRKPLLLRYSQIGQDKFVLSFFNNKYHGTFLDIGCQLPEEINNTMLLEENGWTGLSLDIEDYSEEWKERKNPFIQADALTCDYYELFKKHNMASVIDYLSIDIEGDGSRIACLKKILDTGYEFKVITIEHDAYRGFDETERKPQRELLTKKKYTLLNPDIELDGQAVEDWWINPKYIKNGATV
jgi:FkbM family methyltransferase